MKQGSESKETERSICMQDGECINSIYTSLKRANTLLKYPPQQLFTLLDKVSWNLNDFSLMLSDNAESQREVYWDSYEDEILQSAQSAKIMGIGMLKKFKGANRVRERVRFLGLGLQL